MPCVGDSTITLRRWRDEVWLLDATDIQLQWDDGGWRLRPRQAPREAEAAAGAWIARSGLAGARFATVRTARRAISAAAAVDPPPEAGGEPLVRAGESYWTRDGRFEVTRCDHRVLGRDRHGRLTPILLRWRILDHHDRETAPVRQVASLHMAGVMIRELRLLHTAPTTPA